jgi:hypothetical protein
MFWRGGGRAAGAVVAVVDVDRWNLTWVAKVAEANSVAVLEVRMAREKTERDDELSMVV